ncbi:hypothetical protein ACO2Q0_09635 [Phenylobacterium sp. VNQ135]|uniref:hypothetical protein n=1 Tax=Phenylobacterium sp. VNQ135 TaxID=3400922 RepID=UPI003BFAA7C6
MGTNCESCGMPVEGARYCGHCMDARGALQDFDTRLERMTGYRMGAFGETREAARRAALADMALMPAWREHPQVRQASS